MGEFDKTIGVTLIGLFFNTYLYGLVTMQFLRYWSIKFEDPPWVRFVVGNLFLLDTAQSAIGVYLAWDLCVKNFDNRAILLVIPWESSFTALLTSLVAIQSQFFLAHRVLRLSKSRVLCAIIVLLSLLGFIGGFAAGIKAYIIKEASHFGEIQNYVVLWLSCQTAADLVITVALSLTLRNARTGFHSTDDIINKLIRAAVRTGAFASLFALGDLFTYLLQQKTDLYAMFVYPIGRIYTNTLLDTLNSRAQLRTDLNGRTEVLDSDASIARAGLGVFSRLEFNPVKAIPLRGVHDSTQGSSAAAGGSRTSGTFTLEAERRRPRDRDPDLASHTYGYGSRSLDEYEPPLSTKRDEVV